jgi:hypothetical protein
VLISVKAGAASVWMGAVRFLKAVLSCGVHLRGMRLRQEARFEIASWELLGVAEAVVEGGLESLAEVWWRGSRSQGRTEP